VQLKPVVRILVAVKAGERGLPLAAERARFVAQEMDAEIRLVSCIFDSQVAYALARGKSTAGGAQAGLLANEEANLDRIARLLRDWGARVSTHVVWQSVVHEGLLRYISEWRADLVVVGAHRRGAMPHTRLAETDWQLLRYCPAPLLIAKDETFASYRTILAAVDPVGLHEEPAGLDELVLDTARAFQRAYEGRLIVAHAYPDPESLALASAVEVEPGRFYGTEAIASTHATAVAALLGEQDITDAQIECRAGEPAAVIADLVQSEDVKLVVLGALKRSQIAQLVLGSTAEKVAYEVNCDVLLVRLPI
jgi:universal stress protein E